MPSTLDRATFERITVAALRDCVLAHGSNVEGSWIGSAAKRIVAGIINHETNRQNNAETSTAAGERETSASPAIGSNRKSQDGTSEEFSSRESSEGGRKASGRVHYLGQSTKSVGDRVQGGVNTPDIGPAVSLAQQMDVEAAFNMRGWVQKALEAKGGEIVGAGIGCGGCDLDVVVEGFKFNVWIEPR